MSRLKFPLTRRDKYFIFGNEDQALDELEGQEFYIRGAVRILFKMGDNGKLYLKSYGITCKRCL